MKCKLNLLRVRKPWNKICPCFHYHFVLKVCVTVARSQSTAANQLAMQWKTYTMFIAFYAAAVVRTVRLYSRCLEVICKKKWGTGQRHKRGDRALSPRVPCSILRPLLSSPCCAGYDKKWIETYLKIKIRQLNSQLLSPPTSSFLGMVINFRAVIKGLTHNTCYCWAHLML